MTAPTLSPAAEAARAGDEPRFLAALCAPPERREPLFALVALNLELARIPVTVSEPMLGEIRLEWWREALEDLFERGKAAGHEVIAALAAAPPPDPAPLYEMVEARRLALAPGGLSESDLDAFLAGTAGALMRAEVQALGGGAKAEEAAALAGWAEGAGRLVAALPAMMAEGSAPFDEKAAREGAALRARLAALANEGLARLARARAMRREVPRAARAPLLSVHVAERALLAALKPGYDPFAPEAPSPFRLRAGLLARAALGRY